VVRPSLELRTQDVQALNGINNFRRLPSGSFVVASDLAPNRFSFPLAAGANPQEALIEVLKIVRHNDPQAAGFAASDYKPIFATPLTIDTEAECRNDDKKPWPYDHSELQKVLRLRALIGSPIAGRQVILDTGFPPAGISKDPFRPELFVKRRVEPDDTDENPYLWSTSYPPVYHLDGYEHSDHGVSVVTLALGGIDALREGVLSGAVDLRNGIVLSMMGYVLDEKSKQLALDGNGVLQTLATSNSGRQPVKVVNLSLSLRIRAGENAEETVQSRQRILFVFAAGNGGVDLRRITVEPASWGGEKGRNVITVGAITPSSTLATFSNYGKTRVDIGAPGCAVPTLVWNNTKKSFDLAKLNGTSLAAPLTSFAASLLGTADYDEGGAMKARILASGRYSAKLEEKVRSKRMLDIATAVAYPFDVVRWHDGTIRYGRVNWPESRAVCSTPLTRREHPVDGQRRPLQLNFSGPHSTVVRWVLEGTNRTDLEFDDGGCALERGELPDITFQEAAQANDSLDLSEKQLLLKFSGTGEPTVDSITFCDVCYSWPLK
jgi:subtilisin family serine protease